MSDFTLEILLVEDNLNDAELSLYALRKFKIANQIHHARDGAEALDYIFGSHAETDSSQEPAQSPRVMLLDLKLPKADGLEVSRKLKANEISRTIQVVVLTSSR